MKSIQIILVLLYFSISMLNGQSQINYSEDWHKLSIDQYEIMHPIDWDIDTSGQAGTRFLLLSPIIDKNDQFRENVNLLIQDLTGHNLSLDQYVNLTENQVKTLIQNGEIIVSERVNIGTNDEYHKMVYSGKQGIYDLKFQQYFWVIAEEAIIVTFTSEESEFEKYQSVGESILNSFIIKN